MQYLKVRWQHADPAYPVLYYSELDDGRWEKRKVEFFPDGRIGYAESEGNSYAVTGTQLSLTTLPDLAEIVAEPQFQAEIVNRDEFEAVMAQALANRPIAMTTEHK
jgi:hypothetical protein